MKRWIALAVSAVLLLFAGLSSMGEEVRAGKGGGKSEKIESIQDFFDLTDSFSSFDISDLRSSGKETAALLSNDIYESEKEEEKKSSKYRNLTFNEISSAVDKRTDKDYGNIQITFRRELTGYMTEEAVYYHSEGVITSDVFSAKDILNAKDIFNRFLFNMDIYLDSKDIYIRFHEFLSMKYEEEKGEKNEETIRIPDEWKDVWISCEGEMGELLLSTVAEANGYNISVISYIGNLFDKYTEGEFKREKKRFLLESNELGIEDGSLELNLDDPQNPQLSLLAPQISDVLSFSDINNTVVEPPKSFKLYDPSDLVEFLKDVGE